MGNQKMKMQRRRRGVLIYLSLAMLAMTSHMQAADVPKWTPADIEFKANAGPSNPFMVAFSASITGPDGQSFEIPGFYDGEGTWKIRVSPTTEGKWSLVTKSELKTLAGQQAEFMCVKNSNPNVHGVLRVDPDASSPLPVRRRHALFHAGL